MEHGVSVVGRARVFEQNVVLDTFTWQEGWLVGRAMKYVRIVCSLRV